MQATGVGTRAPFAFVLPDVEHCTAPVLCVTRLCTGVLVLASSCGIEQCPSDQELS
jgi:hypothetical protein